MVTFLSDAITCHCIKASIQFVTQEYKCCLLGKKLAQARQAQIKLSIIAPKR
jgi:hypothetical protein